MLQQTSRTKWHPHAGLHRRLTGIALLLGLLSAGCQQSYPLPPSQPAPATVQIITPDSLDALHGLFKASGYDWEKLDAGVPPLIVTRFPDDLDHRLDPEQKKRTFLLSLLPMVLLANQAIEAERKEIETLLARHDRLGLLEEADRFRLRKLAENYKLQADPLTDRRARAMLLHRVDILPPSLVLAQAATESGWGTSRFAREGNNLFGQRTFRAGNGIVPAQRPEGETHEVKRFGSLFESVRGYMRNLNTHDAYRGLREIRAKLRRSGQPLSGAQLAAGLESYSTRSSDYINDVRAIIRANGLSRANQTFLRAEGPHLTAAFLPTVAHLLESQAEAAEPPAE